MENLNNLIRCDSEELPDHLLGVAIRLDADRKNPHSGVFIRYDKQNYIFHFTGKGDKVFLHPPTDNDWFFFKALTEVKYYIPSVYAHFRRIKRKSKPDYFYLYSGGAFDQNGDFTDTGTLPNYMTCVGFCLAVLKHSLTGIDLIQFEDWPAGILNGKSEDYVKNFYDVKIAPNYPDISFAKFSNDVRRITPLDYITAGFSSVIPVPKTFIDNQKSSVKKEIYASIDNWKLKSL